MFEGDPNNYLGLALRNNRAAREAAADADESDRIAWLWKNKADQLQARIFELEKQLAVANADAHGRLAQVNALMTAHPGSPELADSGRRFKDGKVKTTLRLV